MAGRSPAVPSRGISGLRCNPLVLLWLYDRAQDITSHLDQGSVAHDFHGCLLRSTVPPIVDFDVAPESRGRRSKPAVRYGMRKPPRSASAQTGEVYMESSLLCSEILLGGATWSHVLKRGTALRITDIEGGANVAAYFLNFENPSERFNLPDTLKAQHTARLTAGHVLFSDMGRVLCSIVKDTVGWHDPIAGISNASLIEKKYGKTTYQKSRNDWYQNARDGFLVELGKYGMGPRDLHATVNFFSKVVVDDSGRMQFVGDNSRKGSYIELRAEMNVLVLLNASPHPLDSNPHYVA